MADAPTQMPPETPATPMNGQVAAAPMPPETAVNPVPTVAPAAQAAPVAPTAPPSQAATPTPVAPATAAPVQTTGQVTTMERPGLVTFAAIMLLLFAGFQMTWAIVEFSNAPWISGITYGSFGGFLWSWGLLDLVLALVGLYAGFVLLNGGWLGQMFGVLVASISAIRWFFYIPALPWMSLVMIAVDVLIIYGLVKHADYFAAGS